MEDFLSFLKPLISAIISLINMLLPLFRRKYRVSNDGVEVVYFFPPLDDEKGNTSSFFASFVVENLGVEPITITKIELMDNSFAKNNPDKTYDNRPEIWFPVAKWSPVKDSILIDTCDGPKIVGIPEQTSIPLTIPAFESSRVNALFPVSGNNFSIYNDHTTINHNDGGTQSRIGYEIRLTVTGRKKAYLKDSAPVGIRFSGKELDIDETYQRLIDYEPKYSITVMVSYNDRFFRIPFSFTGYTRIGDLFERIDDFLRNEGCDLIGDTVFLRKNRILQEADYNSEETLETFLYQETDSIYDTEIIMGYGGIGGIARLGRGFYVTIQGSKEKNLETPCIQISNDEGKEYISLPISSDEKSIVPSDRIQYKKWRKYKRNDRREIKRMIVAQYSQLQEYCHDVNNGKIPIPVELSFYNSLCYLRGGQIMNCAIAKRVHTYKWKAEGLG